MFCDERLVIFFRKKFQVCKASKNLLLLAGKKEAIYYIKKLNSRWLYNASPLHSTVFEFGLKLFKLIPQGFRGLVGSGFK